MRTRKNRVAGSLSMAVCTVPAHARLVGFCGRAGTLNGLVPRPAGPTRWTTAGVLFLVMMVSAAFAGEPLIPIAPGVKIVIAVSNGDDQKPSALEGVLAGDYEMLVELGKVGPEGITQIAHLDGKDAKGAHKRGRIRRLVATADLRGAGQQVFGFHSSDPELIPGTTALGPSLAMTRELSTKGEANYSFRNFAAQPVVAGTLTLSQPARVKFPVLVNGKRVQLDAIRASGLMAAGGSARPFETLILDHPVYPISLRIAWGARGGGHPFDAEFAREVVRIDFADPSLAQALEKECRVELVGLYFDFNLATLKPESDAALREIARTISTAPSRALRLEGHTDNIGNDQYNQDLSRRRAEAVKTALVKDFRMDGAMLSTAGLGESRPVETNDTLAGRARNRRVELVCAK